MPELVERKLYHLVKVYPAESVKDNKNVTRDAALQTGEGHGALLQFEVQRKASGLASSSWDTHKHTWHSF